MLGFIVTTLENEHMFSSVVDKRVVVFSKGKHIPGGNCKNRRWMTASAGRT